MASTRSSSSPWRRSSARRSRRLFADATAEDHLNLIDLEPAGIELVLDRSHAIRGYVDESVGLSIEEMGVRSEQRIVTDTSSLEVELVQQPFSDQEVEGVVDGGLRQHRQRGAHRLEHLLGAGVVEAIENELGDGDAL